MFEFLANKSELQPHFPTLKRCVQGDAYEHKIEARMDEFFAQMLGHGIAAGDSKEATNSAESDDIETADEGEGESVGEGEGVDKNDK